MGKRCVLLDLSCVFAKTPTGDMMSDVARDNSGEGQAVASAGAAGGTNGCGNSDAPLLKRTEDCDSPARRPTRDRRKAMWRRPRPIPPGAHFEADGGANRRCASAVGFAGKWRFCRRSHAAGRRRNRQGGPDQPQAQPVPLISKEIADLSNSRHMNAVKHESRSRVRRYTCAFTQRGHG